MRPTQSATFDPGVGTPAIHAQSAGEVLTQQAFGGLGVAAAMDHEHDHQARRRHPEPGAALRFAPTRFVGMRGVGCFDVGMRRRHRLRQGLGHPPFHRTDAARAHLQPVEQCQQCCGLALREQPAAGQQCHQPVQPRAKVARRHAHRQLTRRDTTTLTARESMQTILVPEEARLRDLRHLMPHRLGVRADQADTTVTTRHRHALVDLVHILDRYHGSRSAGMTWLPAALLGLLARPGRSLHRWTIARRRLRRVPRVLAETLFQLQDPRTQIGILSSRSRQGVLQLRDVYLRFGQRHAAEGSPLTPARQVDSPAPAERIPADIVRHGDSCQGARSRQSG